jgi:hypothetical protein
MCLPHQQLRFLSPVGCTPQETALYAWITWEHTSWQLNQRGYSKYPVSGGQRPARPRPGSSATTPMSSAGKTRGRRPHAGASTREPHTRSISANACRKFAPNDSDYCSISPQHNCKYGIWSTASPRRRSAPCPGIARLASLRELYLLPRPRERE